MTGDSIGMTTLYDMIDHAAQGIVSILASTVLSTATCFLQWTILKSDSRTDETGPGIDLKC